MYIVLTALFPPSLPHLFTLTDFTFGTNSVSYDSEFVDFATAWDASFGDFDDPGFATAGGFSLDVLDPNSGDLVFSNALSGASAVDFITGDSAFAFSSATGSRDADGSLNLDTVQYAMNNDESLPGDTDIPFSSTSVFVDGNREGLNGQFEVDDSASVTSFAQAGLFSGGASVNRGT